MHEITSLSLFVGTGTCNAKCAHCAGLPLRKFAPKKDGEVNEALILETLRNCYGMGARSLSLSSSGEPTLSPRSVTRVLKLVRSLKPEGIVFPKINLYTNGIRIGTSADFCRRYLRLWKTLGLTTIYVTIHHVDEKLNTRVFGIRKYAPLNVIVSRIKRAGFSVRANLILNKEVIGTFNEFRRILDRLKDMGVDFIAAWSLRDKNDNPTKLPPAKELSTMRQWVKYDPQVRFLEEIDHVKAYNSKLTLFQDGTLSNTWCN